MATTSTSLTDVPVPETLRPYLTNPDDLYVKQTVAAMQFWKVHPEKKMVSGGAPISSAVIEHEWGSQLPSETRQAWWHLDAGTNAPVWTDEEPDSLIAKHMLAKDSAISLVDKIHAGTITYEEYGEAFGYPPSAIQFFTRQNDLVDAVRNGDMSSDEAWKKAQSMERVSCLYGSPESGVIQFVTSRELLNHAAIELQNMYGGDGFNETLEWRSFGYNPYYFMPDLL